MNRRHFLALALASVLPAAVARAAAPLLFHEHGHGLAFSSDGKLLLAPSRTGLAAYDGREWHEMAGPRRGFSGFAVAEHAIYASGPGAGLLRSIDDGDTWQAIGLPGEDLRLLGAGYRAGAIYVLRAAGLFVTRDEGKSWRAAEARGLAGEIHALGVHPTRADTVAVGTGSGLYLSRDGGQKFARLDRSEPATALTFDHEGARLFYARALSNDLIDRALEGRGRRRMRLPHLAHDYLTCLAHSPTDERTMAFATRKLNVYMTRDGGRAWQRIASAGEADAAEGEMEHDHR